MVNVTVPASTFRCYSSLFILTLMASTAHGFLPPSSHTFTKSSSIPIMASSNTNDSDDTYDPHSSNNKVSRRQILPSFLLTTGLLLAPPPTAQAFPNKISDQYNDRPKRRGPPPKDLNISKRKDMLGGGDDYDGLKPCASAPNCFCSTVPTDYEADHYLPPWIWPKDLPSQETAFQQLEDVVQRYEPGQGGIDGGGFAIQKSEPRKGYLYVQFEALKNGYIDDVEFAVLEGAGEREVQVRSSSRVGYLDYGVNAKRLNYIARALGEKGWKAEGVDFKTHPDYATQNGIART